MLDTGVFSLGVLPDEDGIHVIVRSLETFDGYARPHVSKKVECTSQRQVQ